MPTLAKLAFSRFVNMFRITTLYLGIFLLYPTIAVFLTHHTNSKEKNFEINLMRLLKSIKLELNYDYMIMVKDSFGISCLFEKILKYINDPLIILSELSDDELTLKHSKNVLILACSDEYLKNFNIWNTQFQMVHHVILSMEKEEEKVIELCFSIKGNGYFQHILLTMESLNMEMFYNCNLRQQLQRYYGFEGRRIFQNDFLNMQGLPLITESNQLPILL